MCYANYLFTCYQLDAVQQNTRGHNTDFTLSKTNLHNNESDLKELTTTKNQKKLKLLFCDS